MIRRWVVETTMIRTAHERGSVSGKESAEATIRMLAGWRVLSHLVTGNKVDRAEPYAAQVQAGNVLLLAGEWNRAFIDEHETFPAGKYKDQVDAAAGAFSKLRTGSPYDSSMMWVSHTDGRGTGNMRLRNVSLETGPGSSVHRKSMCGASYGGLQAYKINSNQITGSAFIGTVGLDWQFSGVGNFSSVPGESGLVASLARPGGATLTARPASAAM
jgi:hypothetical protein